MLAFQWKALRTGERVLVHDDHSPHLDIQAGIVTIVRVRPGYANDVAIRIEATGRIERPRRHAVHLLPLDRRFSCWRCDASATPALLGTTDRNAA